MKLFKKVVDPECSPQGSWRLLWRFRLRVRPKYWTLPVPGPFSGVGVKLDSRRGNPIATKERCPHTTDEESAIRHIVCTDHQGVAVVVAGEGARREGESVDTWTDPDPKRPACLVFTVWRACNFCLSANPTYFLYIHLAGILPCTLCICRTTFCPPWCTLSSMTFW